MNNVLDRSMFTPVLTEGELIQENIDRSRQTWNEAGGNQPAKLTGIELAHAREQERNRQNEVIKNQNKAATLIRNAGGQQSLKDLIPSTVTFPINARTGVGIETLKKDPIVPTDVSTNVVEKEAKLKATENEATTNNTDKGKSGNGISTIPTPTFETKPYVSNLYKGVDYQQELRDLVKDKPYSNWDYIRDMSAGLLASDNPSFLGALGEASLSSNANRSKVVSENDALNAKLKVASANSKEAWAKLDFTEKNRWDAAQASAQSNFNTAQARVEAAKLIADAKVLAASTKKGDEIEAARLLADAAALKVGSKVKYNDMKQTVIEMVNGAEVTTVLRGVESGIENIPPQFLRRIDGKYYAVETSVNNAGASNRIYTKAATLHRDVQESIGKSTNLYNYAQGQAEGLSSNGQRLHVLKDTPEYLEFNKKLRKSGTKLMDLYTAAINSTDPDGNDIRNFSAALASQPQLEAQYKNLLASGPMAEMSEKDFTNGGMLDAINSRANSLVETAMKDHPYRHYNPQDFIRQATNDVLANADFTLTGPDRFLSTGSRSTLGDVEDLANEMYGGDEENFFFTFAATNMQNYPPSHPKAGRAIINSIGNRPDENSFINKTQWELLGKSGRNEVNREIGLVTDEIVRETNFTKKRVIEDLYNSTIEANSIYGGEDVIGWNNIESKFYHPEFVYIEPKVYKDANGVEQPTSNLRSKNHAWNAFKGEWFTYDADENYLARRPKQWSSLKKIRWPGDVPSGNESNY